MKFKIEGIFFFMGDDLARTEKIKTYVEFSFKDHQNHTTFLGFS